MVEGNIATIRTADTCADVLTTGRVMAVKMYEPDAVFGGRWAALLGDSSGEVPIFGFGKPPPMNAWIAVRGNVGGFTQDALEDQAFVSRLVAERGWVDSVEIGVYTWHVIEAPRGPEDD